MILQALVEHYEDLVKKGIVTRPGLGKVKVSYVLYLNDNGEIIEAVSTKRQELRGKKTVIVPQEMIVPSPVKRASNVSANFLCDHSGYLLGVDDKAEKLEENEAKVKKIKRALDCFENAKQLHQMILGPIQSPASIALVKFWENWNPEKAKENRIIRDIWEDLISGVNIVFRYKDKYCHEYPEIIEAWMNYYMSGEHEKKESFCMVTGKPATIQAIHPAIKGIKGAQSSGAALVSFNAPAFCSYGKEQNYNAPVGQYASFAYTTALNHLIADRKHTYYVGNTIVLFWSRGAERAYSDFLASMLFGADSKYTTEDMKGFIDSLSKMVPIVFDKELLDPTMDFYILGIAPNSARLSVRFFIHNSFGKFIDNINKHYTRMEIIKPKADIFAYVPIWKVLDETVNHNSKNKDVNPNMAGDLVRSVLTNTYYPATLLNGITLRIRAEHTINRARAGIIKAFYSKNKNNYVPEEVLKVSLNPDSNSIPYQLGRLFSVLENIQEAANPTINATIKDKYFNSASSIPAVIFPVLINLSQKHLKKLNSNKGLKIALEKELTSIMGHIDESFPRQLNLPEQGAFQLGYYHQTQARYQNRKKEESTNV